MARSISVCNRQIDEEKLRHVAEMLSESYATFLGRRCIVVSSGVLLKTLGITHIKQVNITGFPWWQEILKLLGEMLGASAIVYVGGMRTPRIYFVFDRAHMLRIATYFAGMDRTVYVFDLEKGILANASYLTYLTKVELVYSPNLSILDLADLHNKLLEEADSRGIIDLVDIVLDIPHVKILYTSEHAGVAREAVELLRKLEPNARLVKVLLYTRYIPELMEPPRVKKARHTWSIIEALVRKRTTKYISEQMSMYALKLGLVVGFGTNRIRIEYTPDKEQEAWKFLNEQISNYEVLYVEHRYILDIEPCTCTHIDNEILEIIE